MDKPFIEDNNTGMISTIFAVIRFDNWSSGCVAESEFNSSAIEFIRGFKPKKSKKPIDIRLRTNKRWVIKPNT